MIARRTFLRGSVAFTLGAVASPLLATPPAPLGFGFSLYGMKSLPLAEALKTCAGIGYDNVEFALMSGYATEPKQLSAAARHELRGQLSALGLKLSALMDNLSLVVDDAAQGVNLDRIKAAAELAHTLSPAAPPVLETVCGGNPAKWDEVKERMAERLRAWAEAAAAQKLVVAVKPHVGGALHTPEGALWLARQVPSPWIKLVFDQSHYALRGLKLADTLPALIGQSVFIHVKDGAGDAAKFQFLLPGEGKTDYVDYFTRLKAADYRGAVVVEVSGQIFNRPGYDPIAVAKQCYANLAPAFAKAGLARLAR